MKKNSNEKEVVYKYSSNIKNSLVKRKTNILFEKAVKTVFRKVNFGSESILTLENYSEKGKIIFASFQSSNTSLLILMNLLRKNNFKLPFLALGTIPYAIQAISNMFKILISFLINIFSKGKAKKSEDRDVIKTIIDNDETIVLSLLSKKLFRRRYFDKKNDNLQTIIEIQKEIEEPIFLFPQIMFWNRNPERTKTIVSSKATGDRGIISAIFTTIKSVTKPFMRVAEPINVKEFIEKTNKPDTKQLARELRNALFGIYNSEKRSILGPILKTQQEMIEKILYHDNILNTIQEVSGKENISEDKLRKKAYAYYKEIAADFSIIYIKYFKKTLYLIYNKIFDGIRYNQDDFKMLREASQKGPLIIMPSHKSHMDYLIISSIFYHNKLIPPHILAGSNLTFFPMGKIFRRSGAFFMRRSFKGLDLYSSIFKQYIKTLINENYSIEFFIEGGRSRSGKLMPPKMGIMKYLLESIDEGYNKDLMFVPVTINYDRILEEDSYHGEIKGKEKKGESTSGFLKSRKLLKRQYGKVYLSFNTPISYNEMKIKFEKSEDLVGSIGKHVLDKINEIIMVTPFSITTSAMLLSSAKGFTQSMIKEKITLLLDYLNYINAPMPEALESKDGYDEVIEYVIDSYKQDDIVSELKLTPSSKNSDDDNSEEKFYVLHDEDRTKISYYKNSIIHYLIPISFTSIVLLYYSKEVEVSYTDMANGFTALRDMFSKEFIYPAMMGDTEESLNLTLKYLEDESIIIRNNNKISLDKQNYSKLVNFSRIMQDYFESYYTVLDTLITNKDSTLPKKELIGKIRRNGIRMYHLGDLNLVESISTPYYNNALKILSSISLLEEDASDRKNVTIKVIESKKIENLRNRIKEYLNDSTSQKIELESSISTKSVDTDKSENINKIH